MFESDPWNQKDSTGQIKYEDEDNSGSVFQSDFNPEDLERSTSAPPVLELASESLFAFNTDGFEPAGILSTLQNVILRNIYFLMFA